MIYLDNAATTKPLHISFDDINKMWGNPSSLHAKGQASAGCIKHWTEELINCLFKDESARDEYEVIFTSGGSESDCLAILGLRYNKDKKHIITSCIEHKAVLNACRELEKHFGFRITYLPVDKSGFVNPADVVSAITDNTCLVSIMAVNNEIGSIQPIDEIANICRNKNIIFHTDAVQSNFHRFYDGVDMISLSGHKFHSIKGIGCLIKKKNISLEPIIYGGSQQNGLRAGTENVYGIVNMCMNYKYYSENKEKIEENLIECGNFIKNNLLQDERVSLNAQFEYEQKRDFTPNILSFKMRDIPSDALEIILSSKGICISTNSACNSKSLTTSHVLTNIGLSKEEALSTIRISLPPDIDGVGISKPILANAIEIIIESMDMLDKIFKNNRG